jgi:hypothetical protein
MNGCDRAYLQSYISEFLWRQWNDVDRVDAYDSILQEIGNHYPTDTLKLINFEENKTKNCDGFFVNKSAKILSVK